MLSTGKPAFPGGIHPTDGFDKAMAMDAAVTAYDPETVTLLTEQSPSGKCELLVQPGDAVTEGQLIGKPASLSAAPLHASVTGKVLKIQEVENLGRTVTACLIKREKTSPKEPAPYQTELADIRGISREQILKGLLDGGLVGMGGAGFPTHRKYETDKPIDTLLINGAECEPFLTCDYRLMLEEGCALLNGARLLQKAAGAKTAYLCLEDNKPKAAEHLREILTKAAADGILSTDARFEVKVLPTKYPQGGERQLIQGVLGREVPIGGLPADVGVLVSNVGTAKAAADAILGNLPLTRRIVTVTGAVQRPGNYLVPIGTSVKDLVQLCGGVTIKENRIIAGGPMTGLCAAQDWNGEAELFYVTKSTSGVLVLPKPAFAEQPCIRCRACESVCPAGLIPYQIDFAYLEEDDDLCEQLHASECIACGCCSYTCPAKRELTLRTRLARDRVKQIQKERAVKSS